MNDDTTTCKIEGCERPKRKRGWCNMHYKRWYKHGDPTTTLQAGNPKGINNRVIRPVEDRFWEKVDANGVCWEWTKGKFPAGYGKFSSVSGTRLAHRIAWEMLIGPIADGLELDHRCRNRACVNPEHLEPVTHAENVRRGTTVAVTAVRVKSITHCPHGHKYTEANTSYKKTKSGGINRICRTCARDYYHRVAKRKRRAQNEA